MISGSHHRVSSHHHQGVGFTRQPESPTSTYGSDDSEPNDLTTSKSLQNLGSASYPYYSPPHHGSSQQSPFTATNDCRIIEYRGHRIAAFLSTVTTKNPAEYLLCLPQAFELFLKHLVGGLHTVYTKLKRLDIVPIVCNVEQVRILRGLGAIQPGVNRCKLLSTKDFDVLYKDCTTASRPGRPPKRSPIAGMVSPIPAPITGVTPTERPNVVPFLGFPPSSKKPRFGDEADFGRESPDLKHHHHHNQGRDGGRGDSNGANSAATAAAMLAANGYSAAFPFLQHFAASNNSQHQQQQLAAAAAALGLPGLPSSNRFGSNTSPPPPPPPHQSGQGSNSHGLKEREGGGDRSGHESGSGEFNPTAAYLWLLSQQQHQSAAAAAVLNLSSGGGAGGRDRDRDRERDRERDRDSRDRPSHSSPGNIPNTSNNSTHNSSNNNTGSSGNNNTNSVNQVGGSSSTNNLNSATTNHTGSSNNNNNSNHKRPEEVDDSTDDEDDDVESHNSSRSDNPVSSTGFNGLPAIGNAGGHTGSSTSPAPDGPGGHGSSQPGQGGDHQHSLETLLRNIEGLLAIAAHNARQQQSQLHQQKELRAELAAAVEREREMREQVERQLNDEHKVRMLFQKRFKRERKFRRKLEQELHLNQPKQGQQPHFIHSSANNSQLVQRKESPPIPSLTNGTEKAGSASPEVATILAEDTSPQGQPNQQGRLSTSPRHVHERPPSVEETTSD